MLDTERSYLENIPWSAYVRYGSFYGFTRDQIDWLIEIGFRVDKAILEERSKEQRNRKNGNTSKPS